MERTGETSGLSRLHEAVLQNELVVIEEVLHLQRGPVKHGSKKKIRTEIMAAALAQNSYGDTPLHLAVVMDRLNAARMLVKPPAGPAAMTCTNSSGQTPLLLAIMEDKRDFINLFLSPEVALSSKALNAGNDAGDTPLHVACANGWGHVVSHLLNRGADAFTRNKKMQTALTVAVLNGQADCALMLLNFSSYVADVPDMDGMTALHHAAQMEQVASAKHLLEVGADFEIKDTKDRTALDVAVAAGARQVVNAIKEAAAKKAQEKANAHKAGQETNIREFQESNNKDPEQSPEEVVPKQPEVEQRQSYILSQKTSSILRASWTKEFEGDPPSPFPEKDDTFEDKCDCFKLCVII
mmetsp:Transcript_3347/g.4913  ORF Transcript_3347/g.4913 Transcript_3347/m.4913 type:complete len:353 (-) Transcript_3347:135-1193(-)